MARIMLSEAIHISPGFNTAVSVQQDLNNEAKVAAYIPTEAAREILLDMEKHLHPMMEGRRSRVVTGTYGTGKSHLALVLARMFGEGAESADLIPVLEKLEGKWPGQAKKIREGRAKVGKFFLVLLEGDEGHFEDALLRRLTQSLAAAGLQDVLPDTAFKAAVARIYDLESNYPETYGLLEERVIEFGIPSVPVLIEQLEDSEKATFQKFCDLHREVCAGADFKSDFGMKPREVYAAVAARLKELGFAGISILWDEFGRYMERVVDDPHGVEGDAIQKFAEGCNHGKGKINLYLVCHRSLQEYVSLGAVSRAMGMSKRDTEEWTKICGRFTEFRMRSTDHEVFDLIDQVIIQRESSDAHIFIVSAMASALEECTNQAVNSKLFPEFGRDDVHKVVTLGSFPLHPMASFLLPKISQQVAQNERTMFTFLSDSGPGTLGPFLRTTGIDPTDGWPPFFSADMLWDYFSEDVTAHPTYKRISSRYERANSAVGADSVLEKRVLKALALLAVVDSDRAPATAEMLGMTLAMAPESAGGLRDCLDRLTEANDGQERVLVPPLAGGGYRFPSLSSDGGLEASALDKIVGDQLSHASPAAHLRAIRTELNLSSEQLPMNEIPATRYNDDFGLTRSLLVDFVDPIEGKSMDRWSHDLGQGRFTDGYALVALTEDRHSIDAMIEAASGPLLHPQLVIAVPKDPILFSGLLRRHEALRLLEKDQGQLYGRGAPFQEEWEQQDQEYLDAMSKMLEPLIDPENERMDWFLAGERQEATNTVSGLRRLASTMMRTVFPSTPHIVHDRLTNDEGKDSTRSVRKEIIDTLLGSDGPNQLAAEKAGRNKSVIDAIYRRTQILRKVGASYVLGQPPSGEEPGMHAVWQAVEDCIVDAQQQSIPLSRLVNTLKAPPFGMRARSIPLVAAAVFRPYIERGNLSLLNGSGITLPTISGSILDDALMTPGTTALLYRDIGAKQMAVRDGIGAAFDVFPTDGEDPGPYIERIRETVSYWWRGLSYFSRTTSRVSDQTNQLRKHVFLRLAEDDVDAQTVVLVELVDRFAPEDGLEAISSEAVDEMIAAARRELEGAFEELLRPKLRTAVVATFSTCDESSVPEADPARILLAWFTSLAEERRQLRLPGDATVVSSIAQRLIEAPESIADVGIELAKGIVGTEPTTWTDDTVAKIVGRLEGAKNAIEMATTPTPKGGTGDGEADDDPQANHIRLTIQCEGERINLTLVPVDAISDTGRNLASIVRSTIETMRLSLPSGETETIIVRLISEIFK